MKLDILDMNEFIKLTKAQEVTNPVYFNMGNIPTDDGLFSNFIFGYPGSKDRKKLFGYINLRRKFLHPVMYKLFTSMDKKIMDCINAKRYFRVEGGELVEDDNGKTGVSFFYTVYDELKFKSTGTARRSNYLVLLSKLSKDDIFLDKYPVIPAFFRDFKPAKTSNEKISAVDEVNELYSKIIRLSQTISSGTEYDFMGAITEANIQGLIYDIYEYFSAAMAGKNGIFHRDILGKSIDYATRSVISAPRFKTNSWKDNPVRFGYTGIPLSQAVVLFYPFFVKYIQDFFEEREHELSRFTHEGKIVTVKNLKEQITQDSIKKMISLYIKSTESRFNSITLKADDGKEYPIPTYKEELKRNFTITDLLFIAASDICSDKHVYATRYPIEQYQNIYPSKIRLFSTKDTIEVKLDDLYLPDYPIIYPDYPADEALFVDTAIPYNGYLAALGGDYDGDTISIRGVFTKEANLEAERLIMDKKNILDQMGKNSRKIGNEAVQAIYTLTQ